MYSNRQATRVFITQETNGKPIVFPLTLKPLERILLSFEDFRINNLLPNVTPLNNKLVITHALGGVLDIPIPIKYYTAIQLRTYLNDVLSPYVTVTYDDYHYNFVSTHFFSIDAGTTCRKLIGMVDAIDSNLYPAYTVSMPNKIDMTSTDYITIKIKELSVDMTAPNTNRDGTFVRIPINAPYGETIFYRPQFIHQFLLRKQNLRLLTLELQDQYGNIPTDDFSCTFKVEYVYVPPDQEIDVDESKNDDDTILFTHYDGNVKIKPFIGSSGFALG